MILKLIKHDFKAMMRILAPLLAIYIFASIGFSFFAEKSTQDVAFGLSMLLIVVLITAIGIIYIKSVVGNYFSSIYGKSAYLTHTIPTTAKTILTSKMLAAFLTTIVCQGVFLFSAYIVVGRHFSSIEWQEFIKQAPKEVVDLFTTQNAWLIAGAAVVSTIYSISIAFCACSIGAMPIFKNRSISIPAGIISYFVLNQILDKIFSPFIWGNMNSMRMFVLNLKENQNFQSINDIATTIKAIIQTSLIFEAITIIALFFITSMLIKKQKSI